MHRNGGKKVVIGMSGGKDSTVVAALCVEALGKENVVGVSMIDGYDKDLGLVKEITNYLGIELIEIDIYSAKLRVLNDILTNFEVPSKQAQINIIPRLRMTYLYAIAQTIGNCRVTCNSNLSEDFIGFATKYGDTAGDLAPIQDLTVTEVRQVGRELDLPIEWIDKTPIDGLCGKNDEESFGFTYEVLDRYIREGVCQDISIKNKIDEMHRYNKHKLEVVPKFNIH